MTGWVVPNRLPEWVSRQRAPTCCPQSVTTRPERISSRASHARIGEQRLLCESFYIRADGSKLLWRHISLSGDFVRKLTVEPDRRCEKSWSCLERSPEDCCISVQYGGRGRSFPNFVRWGTTSGAVYPGCSLCYSRNRRGRNLAREFHR